MPDDDTSNSDAPTRHSRRAVVAAGAWTAPLVVAGTAAPAFAASPCGTTYTYRLNWGTSVFTRPSAQLASVQVASTDGGPNLFVRFDSVSTAGNVPDATRNMSIPGPTAGSDANLDPAITNLGGLGAGERGMRFQHATSTAGRNARQEITVSFRATSANGTLVGVNNLAFWITDIDAITTSPYSDRVELTGTFNQTRDANITGLGSVASPWLNTNTNQNYDENSATARVNVVYPGRQSGFMVTYWNATGGTQYHRTYLSDFTFTSNACA